MASKRGQAGFFTIDALFGLIVLSIMLSLAGWWMLRLGNHQDYRIAAEQQRTVADAFAKYLKDNYAVVLSNAGPTTPVQVTVDMMQNTKYLPAGFSSTNSFGQTIVGLARRLNANQLEAIVVTTGGQAIPELGIRSIAEHLGGPGGFISALKPGVIQGIRGGWELALSNYGINPGQGHTASALFLMDGDLANDYLYRNAVPGHPEYNRMNTAIDMGGNDINNARAVTATNDITSKDGWFRSQNDTGWVNEKWGGGIYQSDADWVRVLNDKGLLTGGKVRGGTLQSDGRVTVGEYLDIESTAQEGQLCSKIGLQSKSSLGAPLACQCVNSSCGTARWTGVSSELGGWQLGLAGSNSYSGTGTVSGGLFSGTIKCRSSVCGGFGYVFCGSDVNCTVANAGALTHYNFYGFTVGVKGLPVTSAVREW
ncbi:shufflon system plasmid conjugative transfer pilus tip adhesin PilV [Pseudomonas mosselii]|uniref:shufflon system plasmid conjugative transfer pilus tip adhesin PilV n=1 Tax=Pseudomonas mosselii TaxID=78327 RepID=UPI001BD5A23C|nr:shufflon system plasmid conjugative transfer pilus tip adhesin PilV [Pseudomonas mosselii]MBS9759831.1 shufflon system plasmid conjugative transfer pilus tip adhesin PilV [Pseudomonas mosselii]